ncbi:hypothetical protein Hanom_Chr04g00322801 [Helianthus anomalus]
MFTLGKRARIIMSGVKFKKFPLNLKGKLSRTPSALCGIIQIHQCCSTCSPHKHPSLLCTSDEDLSTCMVTKLEKFRPVYL